MNFKYFAIEQLDFAGKQLDKDNANFSRYALILVDNLVELLLLKKCQELSYDNGLWTSLGKPKLSKKEVELANSQYFNDKALLCKNKELISNKEYEYITICHSYRNLVYHNGLIHEKLIYPIAWSYHEFCCCLFGRYKIGFNYFSSGDIPSSIVLKHIGQKESLSSFSSNSEMVEISLKNTKTPLLTRFNLYLSNDLTTRKDEIMHAIQFLTENNPWGNNRNDILDYLNQQNRTKYDADKILSDIESNTKKIALEIDNSTALIKYNNFSTSIIPFENLLFESASSLDEYIQLQIDIARGK